MNQRESVVLPEEPKPSRLSSKRKIQLMLLLGSLLILLAIIMPFALHYDANQRTIKRIEELKGTVEVEPGWLLEELPFEQELWLRARVDQKWFKAFENISKVTLSPIHGVREPEELFLMRISFFSGSRSMPGKPNDFETHREYFHRFDHAINAGDYNQRGHLTVEYLNQKTSRVNDAELIQIKGLSNLNELHLSYTNITDAGLVHLKELGNLQILTIGNTSITNAGLHHLQSLTNLQELWLNETKITGAGLISLHKLPHLHVLNLSGTQLTGSDLIHLKKFTDLERLYLRNVNFKQGGLVHLKGLTSLEYLDLQADIRIDRHSPDYKGIAADDLLYLKGLTNLKALNLQSTNITDASLVHLKGMTHLQFLDLSRTSISDAGLAHLKGLTSLMGIDLSHTNISRKGAEELDIALPACFYITY